MQKQTPQLETVSAKDLLTRPIEPLRFTIDDILPCGLFILAGSAKIGKSWLALDMSNCVAGGDTFWNFHAEQGDVLYLALEDNHRRLQERLNKVSPYIDIDSVTDIHFVTEAKKLGDGLAEQLIEFLNNYPQTRLIVIDTLQYIRNNGKFTGTYSGDYHDMDALREIIAGRELSMLLITHTRKTGDADPVNLISGSTGLAGAVDGIFVLEKDKRVSYTAKLTIANRDTVSRQFELRFDKASCRWQFVEELRDEDEEDGEVERELYEMLLILLDAENPTWKGTATDLYTDIILRNPMFMMSSIMVAKTLRRRRDFLLSEYGITCTFTRSKSTRLIELSRNVISADFEVLEDEPLRLVG